MFDTSNFTRTLAGVAAALMLGGTCLVAAAGPAAAQTPDSNVKVVSYGDLNLNTAAGRATFDARVKSAAKSVCKSGLGDLSAQTIEAQCVEAAIKNAQAVTRVTAS